MEVSRDPEVDNADGELESLSPFRMSPCTPNCHCGGRVVVIRVQIANLIQMLGQTDVLIGSFVGLLAFQEIQRRCEQSSGT